VQRLNAAHGARPVFLPCPIETSGRRWEKKGVLQTTIRNQLTLLSYFCGVPPDTLAEWYYK
jgi:hypothetical protein